jgi:hypothetical protein
MVRRRFIVAAKTKVKIELEDLGLLNIGAAPLLVLPLPRITKSVIVSYDDYFRVSCVVPSKKYTIHVSGGSRRAQRNQTPKEALKNMEEKTILAPSLILSQIYSDVPGYANLRSVNNGAYLYAYHNRNKNKAEIYGAPYLLSNVHAGGHICFGGMSPVTPRESFNTFWGSPFNGELLGEHIDEYTEEDQEDYDCVSDYIDEYHDTVYRSQPWEDLTEVICGERRWACPKKTEALLITSNRMLLPLIPRKFWRKSGNSPFIIARAIQGKRNWKFESGGFKFTLPNSNVTFSCAKRLERVSY